MAKICAAIRAILSAIAACFPIGAPHCTRSLAHVCVGRETPFGQAYARRGQRQSARVKRGQRDA